ncbi:hypothetical protein EUV02_15495 [Polymorphobacter arshaanensis]|uniref:Uncharacterized protein n=1 Tax=Glacieibacterium arshaanense TaxID=2511025 RepID=A0A4Y9EK92_9SPHN|nr:hypothetical protein [Polymorphobacter arshaanensis]TFU00050.1 hypothetical protein EUV02_15495 [Polymorphobacter arshaanensis]
MKIGLMAAAGLVLVGQPDNTAHAEPSPPTESAVTSKPAEEPTPAETAMPSKYLLGIGNSSCSMWTTKFNGDESLMNQAGGWVAGYLSGLNIGLRKAPDFLDGSSAKAIEASVDEYCKTNPNDHISDAVTTVGVGLIDTAITNAH